MVRTLASYIPFDGENKPDLLPYTEALFKNESPSYMIELIKALSPIRLYLYGNQQSLVSAWSNLMVSTEIQMMDDEDSWCAFLENEPIDDEMKWNLGSFLGHKWKVKRLAPLRLAALGENLRFQSALRRAQNTVGHRQLQVTKKVFDWHDECIREGYLRATVSKLIMLEHVSFDLCAFFPKPRLSDEYAEKVDADKLTTRILSRYCMGSSLSSHHYTKGESRGIALIWLDELLNLSRESS